MGKKPALAAATRQKLMDAFWQLYTQKNIEQISIKEITDLAGYNRGTFYLYFKDIYDILNQIEDTIFASLIYSPADDPAVSEALSRLTFREVIQLMTSSYERNSKYVSVLLGEHGDPQFAHKLKQQFIEFFSRSPKLQELDPLTRQYYLEYSTSGLLAMMQVWLKSEPQISVEDFIYTALQVMIPEAFKYLLGQFNEPVGNMDYSRLRSDISCSDASEKGLDTY